MRWYRNTLSSVFFLYLTVLTNVQGSNNNNTKENTYRKWCPSKITIHSKSHFSVYLGIHENSTTFGIFPPLLEGNLSTVCCSSQNISFKFLNDTSGISVQQLLFMERDRREESKFSDNDTLEFYFPAYTAESDATVVYKEFYFLEVMKSPGPAFVMLEADLKEAPDPSLVLIECWPIFLLLLVMAWVVGIIGWCLDRSKNKEQFPSNFYRGSWVGFWWAMVTMTTVGYGDKAPKSFAARVLTVLWMITGTIITSLFTANVTTVLTTKNVAALQNVLGQKIGVLNSKHFFQRQINEGASFIEYHEERELLKALHNGEVSRILVPNYLDHLYFTTVKGQDEYIIANVVKHPFSVGLGLVNEGKTFNDEMTDFLRCWERTLINNFEESGLDYSIIDPSKYHTADELRSLLNTTSILNLIYGLLGVLFIFLITGTIWEIWKHQKQAEKMETMKATDFEMTKTSRPTSF